LTLRRALCTMERIMNTQSSFSRFVRKTTSVERCVARHDGGFLVRLSDGRAGVSHAPIPEGARAHLTDAGMVERSPQGAWR
jgi:hypothetical protein